MSKRVLAGLAAGVVVVAAVGVVGYRMLFAPANDAAVELVPAHAIVYGSAFLDPSNGQKRALEDLVARFPRLRTPERTRGLVEGFVDDRLRDQGIVATYEDDIEPWLGDQVAFFASGRPDEDAGEAGVLVGYDDRDALDDFVAVLRRYDDRPDPRPRSYRGVDYELDVDGIAWGYVDDFYVVASEPAFEDVVDVSEGDPALADAGRYDVEANLEGDRLGTFWIDVPAVLEGLGETFTAASPEERSVFDELGRRFARPAVFGVFARGDGIVTELAVEGELPDDVAVARGLDELPREAWAAVALADVGPAVQSLVELGAELEGRSGADVEDAFVRVERATGLDLDDALGRVGDARAYVGGGIAFGGPDVGIVADVDGAPRLVDDLRAAAERSGVPLGELDLDGYDDGFTVASPRVHVVADGDRVVVALGDAAAAALLDPDETLADSDVFRDARALLGMEPSLFVDLATPIAFVSTFAGAAGDEGVGVAGDWLEPLGHVSFGVDRRDGATVARFALGVAEEDDGE